MSSRSPCATRGSRFVPPSLGRQRPAELASARFAPAPFTLAARNQRAPIRAAVLCSPPMCIPGPPDRVAGCSLCVFVVMGFMVNMPLVYNPCC